VIDYIIYLQKEDYNVRTLLGNHEEFLVKAYNEEMNLKSFMGIKQTNQKKREWYVHGGKEAMKSFGISELKDFPNEYLEWIKNLEYYIELDHFFLVHAGFNFKIKNPFEDKDSMLWIREYDIDKKKIGNKRIVHGHVPVSLEFIDLSIKNKNYPYIDLDNGAYMTRRDGFGNLVALELNSMEYKVQFNLDL
jgi:serine/threonine protein phosphatase 1